MARICEFFIERLCSGLWSGSFSVFPPSHPYFSSFHCFISVTGAWNGGSWLGCGDLPAMGAVFYLGAGWLQWKPLGIPGTHLSLKRGSWLNGVWLYFLCYIQKRYIGITPSLIMFKFPTKLLKSWERATIGNLTKDICLFQKYHNTLCCPSKILHIIKALFSITWDLQSQSVQWFTQPTFVNLACSFQVKMNHNMIDCLIAEFFINKIFLFEVVKFSCTNGCLLATFCRPRKHKLAMYTIFRQDWLQFFNL